jgi:hypothetical protein
VSDRIGVGGLREAGRESQRGGCQGTQTEGGQEGEATAAKTDATRLRRLEQAIEWMAEGKARNWKYERPKAKPKR